MFTVYLCHVVRIMQNVQVADVTDASALAASKDAEVSFSASVLLTSSQQTWQRGAARWRRHSGALKHGRVSLNVLDAQYFLLTSCVWWICLIVCPYTQITQMPLPAEFAKLLHVVSLSLQPVGQRPRKRTVQSTPWGTYVFDDHRWHYMTISGGIGGKRISQISDSGNDMASALGCFQQLFSTLLFRLVLERFPILRTAAREIYGI